MPADPGGAAARLDPIAASAPEELTTISFLMPAPPAPFIPAEVHGQPSLAIMFVYRRRPEAGARPPSSPFRAVAAPLAELVMPMPYVGIYEFSRRRAARPGDRSVAVPRRPLDDAAVDEILARTRPRARRWR